MNVLCSHGGCHAWVLRDYREGDRLWCGPVCARCGAIAGRLCSEGWREAMSVIIERRLRTLRAHFNDPHVSPAEVMAVLEECEHLVHAKHLVCHLPS